MKGHADPPSQETLRRLSPQQRTELMCEMRAGGSSLQEIGQAFGLTRERVRQIIRRAQGPTRQEAAAARQARAHVELEDLREEVLQLSRRSPGLTAMQVADELGVSATSVRAALGDDAGRVLVSTYKATSQFTDAEVLEHLRKAAAVGGEPLTVRMYEAVRGQVGGASSPLVLQRFGTWRAACLAAGVRHGTPVRDAYVRRWSRDQLVLYVAQYLGTDGVRGSFADYERWARLSGGAPSGQTVRTQLGGWSSAKTEALELLARDTPPQAEEMAD